MTGEDFAATAGWGHYGQGDVVMPGQGRVVERACTPEERTAMGGALSTFGETTFDTYLNARAFWHNVPTTLWRYKLGGCQVLKKWLSYRERDVLGRVLTPEEAHTSRIRGGGSRRYRPEIGRNAILDEPGSYG